VPIVVSAVDPLDWFLPFVGAGREGRSVAVIHSLALRARIFGTLLLLARSASEWIAQNFAKSLDDLNSVQRRLCGPGVISMRGCL